MSSAQLPRHSSLIVSHTMPGATFSGPSARAGIFVHRGLLFVGGLSVEAAVDKT